MERRLVISITVGLLALASGAYGKRFGAWEPP